MSLWPFLAPFSFNFCMVNARGGQFCFTPGPDWCNCRPLIHTSWQTKPSEYKINYVDFRKKKTTSRAKQKASSLSRIFSIPVLIFWHHCLPIKIIFDLITFRPNQISSLCRQQQTFFVISSSKSLLENVWT